MLNPFEALLQSHPQLTFWWRDDDAVGPSRQFDQLIALHIPIKLAVIPDLVSKAFDLPPDFKIWQHGFRHTNHSLTKKCELSDETDPAELIQQLKAGQAKLQHLFPHQFENILVPPWNRIDPKIGAKLTFFEAISSFYPNETYSPLPRKDTHLDLVDWEKKQLKSFDQLAIELKTLLKQGISSEIGILSHHLIHKDQDFAQLKQMVNFIQKKHKILDI